MSSEEDKFEDGKSEKKRSKKFSGSVGDLALSWNSSEDAGENTAGEKDASFDQFNCSSVSKEGSIEGAVMIEGVNQDEAGIFGSYGNMKTLSAPVRIGIDILRQDVEEADDEKRVVLAMSYNTSKKIDRRNKFLSKSPLGKGIWNRSEGDSEAGKLEGKALAGSKVIKFSMSSGDNGSLMFEPVKVPEKGKSGSSRLKNLLGITKTDDEYWFRGLNLLKMRAKRIMKEIKDGGKE